MWVLTEIRFTRTHKAEYLTTLQLPDGQKGVTQLAWSSIYPSSFGTGMILSTSGLSGSLHLSQISISAEREDEMSQIQLQGRTQEIEPRQRSPVTRLVWTQWHGDLALVIVRLGRITIKTFTPKGNIFQPSISLSSRYNNFSPVIGFPPLCSLF